MKKISIIIATLLLSACVVPVSIGNKAVAEPKDNNEVVNTVYAKNGKTMVALNYILPQRAGQFEMLTKTIIMPAIKRQDIEVFNSLKFLVPEEPNEDGNLTYMFIADPYLEDKNYDIFKLVFNTKGNNSKTTILINNIEFTDKTLNIGFDKSSYEDYYLNFL